MVDLSIIIISYNTKELTHACLDSILEQTYGISYEIIVLDNSSADGSVEMVTENFPEIHLIALDKNTGFGAGNNVAVKQAQGKVLLLLNPDTVVLDGAVQKLYKFSRNFPDAGIWGGKTLFGNKSLNPSSCWRETKLWEIFCRSFLLSSVFPNNRYFNSGSYGGWKRDSIRNVDIVSGCFFMIEHDTWDKLNGFSPEFFMYGEEADLCLRAKKIGAKPIVTPDATIIHYGGASEKIRTDKMVKLLKAKRLLMKNHWPVWKYKIGMMIYPLYPLNRALVFRVLGFLKEKYILQAADWMEIWHRRKEWL